MCNKGAAFLTGQIRNACLMSIFATWDHPTTRSRTMSTASSKCEYVTENSSRSMPSLTASPRGEDKSRMSLSDPSVFSTAPMGEQ